MNHSIVIDEKESTYLTALYRGFYVNKDLKKGYTVTLKDVYAAVPFLSDINQITSREFMDNEFILNKDLKKGSPLTKDDLQ